MIRKDWYKTIVVETKEGVEQMKGIREILTEHRAEITDFEVDRARDGANMVLKLGIKLYTTRFNQQLMSELGRLDGVKSVKWEVD